MLSRSATDRLKRNRIMDKFCGEKMTYEPENGHEMWDARLFVGDRWVGFAKIFNKSCNFGSQPIVEIPKENVDFLKELSLFFKGNASAVIVKFRNKIAYWRIKPEELDALAIYLNTTTNKQFYRIPISMFRICQ